MHAYAEDAEIDHLVYGVPDLDEGMDGIELLLGTRPARAGRHPAYGTRNALLSLGPTCYLEVIAPDPELPTPDRGIGFGVGGLTKPRLVTWSLRHPAIEAAAVRADLGGVEPGRRERADGTVLSWKLTDPYAERMGGVIPFLIDWGETPHPASSAPSGSRLVGIRLEHPVPARVLERLDLLEADFTEVDVVRGDEPCIVALIETPGGAVELT
jgi:hypothetical protein